MPRESGRSLRDVPSSLRLQRLAHQSLGEADGADTAMRMGALPLLLLLMLYPQGYGKRLLAPPERVRFEAEIFSYVLVWEPPPETAATAGLRYDVQYRQYGEKVWRPVRHCTQTTSLSCDLSDVTWEPSKRYYAHVRALAGNRTSGWAISTPFEPPEATLRLHNISLSVSGNVIHVSLQLPRSRKVNLTYEDIHPHYREYRAHIRRVSNDHWDTHVKTSLDFDIPELLWGESYCICVEPVVASKPIPASKPKEQCVTIPPKEDWEIFQPQKAELLVAGAICSLILLTLASLATGLATVYMRKPAEAPAVLKSLQQHKLPSLLPDPPLQSKDVVLHMAPESVQQLCFLGLKDLPDLDSLSLGSDAVPLPEKQKMEDFSTGSTDSGICLQHPPGSLSSFWVSSWASLGSDKEEGVSAEEQLLQAPQSSVSVEPQAGAAEEKLQAMDQVQLNCYGYRKQSGACPKGIAGNLQAPSSTNEVTHPGLCLPSGYLKQAALVPSDSGAKDGSGTAALSQHYDIPRSLEAARSAPWTPQGLLSF